MKFWAKYGMFLKVLANGDKKELHLAYFHQHK
jgi:hypothetical protein